MKQRVSISLFYYVNVITDIHDSKEAGFKQ
jgi:hypothetical protein